MWFGAERPKWLGPLNHDYPNHLRGEAPADYGYDVLSLGAEPDAFARNFELELLHSRWAMLGAFGALLPGTPDFGSDKTWCAQRQAEHHLPPRHQLSCATLCLLRGAQGPCHARSARSNVCCRFLWIFLRHDHLRMHQDQPRSTLHSQFFFLPGSSGGCPEPLLGFGMPTAL